MEKRSEASPFDGIAWYSSLSPRARGELERNLLVRRYRRERVLFYQEDRSDHALLVLEGSVRLTKWTDSGATILVGHVYEGEWLGLAEAVRRGVYLTDATTNVDSTVASIHHADLIRLLEHESLRRQIVGALASGYYMLHGIIEAHSARTKIARFFGFLTTRTENEESSDSDGLSLEITQEAIANAIGLSRETVNKHLNDLASEGVVRLGRGSIHIVDRNRLRICENASEEIE